MPKIYLTFCAKSAAAGLLLLGGSLSNAYAQLAKYSFTGAAGNEASFAVDAQPVNTTFSPMTRGAGVTPSSGADTFAGSGWSMAAAPEATDYFVFSVQPATGFILRLDNIVLDERRSSTGIGEWVLRSSLDNFATDIVKVAVPDDDLTRANKQINLPAPFARLAGVVEFRLYGYKAEATTGTWRIDNVRVNGAASIVTRTTEPAFAQAVALFPNPAASRLTLRVGAAGRGAQVEIFSALGQRVQQAVALADELPLEVAALPAGLYSVRLTTKEGSVARTFVKR